MVVPPRNKLKALYELAVVVNMRRIRERADYLETQNEAYRPFTSRLRELAKTFEDKQIVTLLQQYMETQT